MLSRIAESLFWVGRYLERSEDTARVLDAHLSQMMEASPVDEALGPDALAALAAGYAGASADTIAQAIQDAALDVQDGGLRDDVALLVVRILPDDEE